YRHGEAGASPRQLTSVVSDSGSVTRFAFDGAGREISSGTRGFGYDGFDELERVLEGGVLLEQHAYGFDGQRVLTRGADGHVQSWFTEDLVDRDGVRQHYVRIGGRTLAR